jgi:high-affinity iron transporter
MREGFETVLFFSALVYSGQGVDLHQGLMGALAGLLVSVVLVWGLLRSTRKVALAPSSAGPACSSSSSPQAALVRRQHVAGGGRHHLLDHAGLQHQPHPRRSGVFGTFLRALFGYNASPAGLQLLTWACYLMIFVTLWHRSYRPQGSAAPTRG